MMHLRENKLRLWFGASTWGEKCKSLCWFQSFSWVHQNNRPYSVCILDDCISNQINSKSVRNDIIVHRYKVNIGCFCFISCGFYPKPDWWCCVRMCDLFSILYSLLFRMYHLFNILRAMLFRNLSKHVTPIVRSVCLNFDLHSALHTILWERVKPCN